MQKVGLSVFEKSGQGSGQSDFKKRGRTLIRVMKPSSLIEVVTVTSHVPFVNPNIWFCYVIIEFVNSEHVYSKSLSPCQGMAAVDKITFLRLFAVFDLNCLLSANFR